MATVLRRVCAYALLAPVLGGGFVFVEPLQPGGKVGTMTVIRGTSLEATKLFDFCNPIVLTPRVLHRTCHVPRANRLFVGYGDFETTKKALDATWKQLRWSLWIDGHPVDLSAFGTSDRHLYAFPPAGGKNVILREWRVILAGVTVGKHTIRYRSSSATLGTSDVTWAFIVEK